MVGAISQNFRQVSFSYRHGQWQLGFVLTAESEEDREEIADIASEFEALQEGSVEYELTIRVDETDLNFPEPPGRVLFRRREA